MFPRTPEPKFCGNFGSTLRSGSGVRGSEGDNSPFRGARTNNIIFGLPAPETPLLLFLGTYGYFRADLPNRTGFRPEQQPGTEPKSCSNW